jgi:hypothetical protein
VGTKCLPRRKRGQWNRSRVNMVHAPRLVPVRRPCRS